MLILGEWGSKSSFLPVFWHIPTKQYFNILSLEEQKQNLHLRSSGVKNVVLYSVRWIRDLRPSAQPGQRTTNSKTGPFDLLPTVFSTTIKLAEGGHLVKI